MKKLLYSVPVLAAASAFANDSGPSWWPSSVTTSVFDDVLTSVAPIAIAVVVGVAGVRVAIKLINRGAGK